MTELDRIQNELGVHVDSDRVPKHIAIIMDGNGRWATSRGLPRAVGHIQGYSAVHDIVRAADDLGVLVLTLYTFSTENWTRPREEVEALMYLIEEATRSELPEFQKNNVRLRVSGDFSDLPETLQQSLREDMDATSSNTGIVLNLAINYGGRQEILDGVKEACRRVASSQVSVDDISEEYFSGLLYTAGLPDPDLVIRTAGELRISNFLLWQIAYAEMWVTDTLWPDFKPIDLIKAIASYQNRVRKFGAVVPPQ